MKFLLFVEGRTEKRILSDLLKRWLDPRLPSPVGIHVVRFEGINYYYAKIQRTVELSLSGKTGQDIIAAIGLIDLYGPALYPNNKRTAEERAFPTRNGELRRASRETAREALPGEAWQGL